MNQKKKECKKEQNFENRSTFGKLMGNSRASCFFDSRSVSSKSC